MGSNNSSLSSRYSNLESISYYKRRHDIVFLGGVIISIVIFAYSLVVLSLKVIVYNPNKTFLQTNIWWLLGIPIITILVLSYFGSRDEPIEMANRIYFYPSSRKSLNCLIVSTVLLVLLVALPIFSFGGSITSCFGSMLITMCGLIVVISTSRRVRLWFVSICLALYFAGSFVSVPIIIQNDLLFSIIHNIVMILTIVIALVLTWKSRIIFDKEMKIEIIEYGNSKVAKVSDKTLINTAQDAIDLIKNAESQGTSKIIVKETNLDPQFFDLKTGIAREILQKVSSYRKKLAIVGELKKYRSNALNAFITECNRGNHIFFVPDLETAIARLNNQT